MRKKPIINHQVNNNNLLPYIFHSTENLSYLEMSGQGREGNRQYLSQLNLKPRRGENGGGGAIGPSQEPNVLLTSNQEVHANLSIV